MKGYQPRDRKRSGQIAVAAHNPTANIFEQIIAWDNLQVASKKVIANNGKHGSDEMTINTYKRASDYHLRKLQEQLKQGIYSPRKLRTVQIPKDEDSKRTIYIPTLIDRIAQQAVLNVVEPYFEEMFVDHSYGFRPLRDAHMALAKVMEHTSLGYQHVVKGDISKYFDSVPHNKLQKKFAKVIADRRVRALVSKMIEGCKTVNQSQDQALGVPQGSVIGPLLSNLYLHQLDLYAQERGWTMVRYADDYLLLFQDKAEAEVAVRESKAFLETNMNLITENKDSSAGVQHFQDGFKFLGYIINSNGLRPSEKAVQKFCRNLKQELGRRKNSKDLERVINFTNSKITGWVNYFSDGSGAETIRALDTQTRQIVREVCRKFDGGKALRSNEGLASRGLLQAITLHHAIVSRREGSRTKATAAR